jgi:hypothetical protein
MQVPIPILGEKKGVRQRQVIMPCRVLGVKLQRILRPRLEPPQRHFTCEHKEGWFLHVGWCGEFRGRGTIYVLGGCKTNPASASALETKLGGLSSPERVFREQFQLGFIFN